MHQKLKTSLLIFFTSLMFTGCYTVVWHPNEELPNNENSVKSETVFYDVNNFGVFNPYYNSPWWLNPDNDFLRDNLNTIMEISGAIDDIYYINEVTRDRIYNDIIPSISVSHARRNVISKTKERKTVSPKIKSTKRTKTERKDKVRNNNGGRKTTKGRSR